MAIFVADYLIEQRGIDWAEAAAPWSWLLPSEFTLWLVNRFADLFLIHQDGTVQMLDVGGGTLEKVAENRDHFILKIDEADHANQWLMIPLVDRLVTAGVVLKPGECYGFKMLPLIGGDYTIDNVVTLPVCDYLPATGALHNQFRDVPDGTRVVLKVINYASEKLAGG